MYFGLNMRVGVCQNDGCSLCPTKNPQAIDGPAAATARGAHKAPRVRLPGSVPTDYTEWCIHRAKALDEIAKAFPEGGIFGDLMEIELDDGVFTWVLGDQGWTCMCFSMSGEVRRG